MGPSSLGGCSRVMSPGCPHPELRGGRPCCDCARGRVSRWGPSLAASESELRVRVSRAEWVTVLQAHVLQESDSHVLQESDSHVLHAPHPPKCIVGRGASCSALHVLRLMRRRSSAAWSSNIQTPAGVAGDDASMGSTVASSLLSSTRAASASLPARRARAGSPSGRRWRTSKRRPPRSWTQCARRCCTSPARLLTRTPCRGPHVW